MLIEEAIKTTYETVGFAVLDVRPIEGTPLFEVDFIGAQGMSTKRVVTFFAMLHEPNQNQGIPCNPLS